MKMILTVTHNCEGEGGNILLQRKDGENIRDMGKIKFESHSDKKWLLKVLMEDHPHVLLSEHSQPCDCSPSKVPFPC